MPKGKYSKKAGTPRKAKPKKSSARKTWGGRYPRK